MFVFITVNPTKYTTSQVGAGLLGLSVDVISDDGGEGSIPATLVTLAFRFKSITAPLHPRGVFLPFSLFPFPPPHEHILPNSPTDPARARSSNHFRTASESYREGQSEL